jgi:hypothetical protein
MFFTASQILKLVGCYIAKQCFVLVVLLCGDEVLDNSSYRTRSHSSVNVDG